MDGRRGGESIRTKKEEGQEGRVHGWREDEGGRGQRGEGDATRLINRHADNHSGFMVTTDYQVVQGGIFHIRDVTLFQWGNTCSARYKLHERAYTGRHVCCLRARPLARPCSCTYERAPRDGTRTGERRTGSRRRRPGAPSLSLGLDNRPPPSFSLSRSRGCALLSKSFPRSPATKVPGHFSERPIP